MESFNSQYSSAFCHLFLYQLGCKLVIRSAIQWLCSREARQHTCHLLPGRRVASGGRVAAAGTGKRQAGSLRHQGPQQVITAWGRAGALGPGTEQSWQEVLGCLHKLSVLLLGHWTLAQLSGQLDTETKHWD